MKVVRQFFDIKERKTYRVGDDYSGNRLEEHQTNGLVEGGKPRPTQNKSHKSIKKNK